MATAAVYEAPNTPFVLKQFPLRPVRRDEVLVRVSMSTICRSDIHSYEGRRPNPCPGILGHEIIGVIAAIGEDIERDMRGDSLKIGDRITWSEYFFEGQCYYREVHDMPQKCQGLRKYGHDLAAEDPHFLGGFAEYCYILPGTWILKLPPDLSDEEATPLNCGVATMAAVTEAAASAWAITSSSRGSAFSGFTARRWPRRAERAVSSVSTPSRPD
jgi:alcohol dehydrogenase